MEEKPIILNGMKVYAAVNLVETIAARKRKFILPDEEISEPVIIMATDLAMADFVLSCTFVTQSTPKHCSISHHMLITKSTNTCRPLVKLVSAGLGFPDYFYN